jgi:PEP-CTERM motif
VRLLIALCLLSSPAFAEVRVVDRTPERIQHETTSVPEPGTLGLAGLGLVIIGFTMARRKRKTDG